MTASCLKTLSVERFPESATLCGGLSSGVLPCGTAGQVSGGGSGPAAPVAFVSPRQAVAAGAMDPHRCSRAFPDRWSAYIRAHFSSTAAVCLHFGVDDRTARKWWRGEGGVRGDKVAMAYAAHPSGVVHYLFAAE